MKVIVVLSIALCAISLSACKASETDDPGRATVGYDYLGHPVEEPRSGQPPEGAVSSIRDYDYQIKYQSAFQVSLWAMPATSIYRFRASAFSDLGVKDNDILTWSGTAGPNLEGLTVNSSTPYIAAYTDLQKGPVVLEVPASGDDGSLYGQVVDAWQFSIADVGPSGLDKGQAAKYIFTPPGYAGEVPDGYIHVASPNYRIALAFRSIVAEGMTEQDAYNYAHKLRIYWLLDVFSG